MPISRTATWRLVLARVGSGEPPVVSPCQVIEPSTPSAGKREEEFVNGAEARSGGHSCVRPRGAAGSAADEISVPDVITAKRATLSADCYSLAFPSTPVLWLNRLDRNGKGPIGPVVIFQRRRKIRPCKRRAGFTLIEIAISVFISMLLTAPRAPERAAACWPIAGCKRSLDAMNKIVRKAQERSVQERRTYVIEWQKKAVVLRPESPREGDPDCALRNAQPGQRSRLCPAAAGGARERSLRAMDFSGHRAPASRQT